MSTVKEYLHYLRQEKYPSLFDGECYERLLNVEHAFGDIKTNEGIMEICLSKEEKACDYSIRVEVENSALVKEYWYELDSEACAEKQKEIPACYFVDASKVIPGKDNQEFYDKVLVRMAGRKRVDNLKDMIDTCVDALEKYNATIFQLGAMNGRGETDSVRLFTGNMKAEDIVSYLKELSWKGDANVLAAFLQKWEKCSERKRFILDFDIFSDHISEKIGINFGPKEKDPKTTETFLNALMEEGLCLPEKKEDVLRFTNCFPNHTPFIQNDISHFKFPIIGDKVLLAKAYLRHGSRCYYNEFKAYHAPVLMNLELTTKCPLRCPQCYCDLEGGKDMDLQTALHFIDDAAKCGVRSVNLSGGETMVYPHLLELIHACHDKGMESNIAISGFGVDKNKLLRIIDSGVSGIFVSLNGSTKEVNSKSRDGYELAIHALELLRELKFERTTINWVMHSNNADDFPNMVTLAEQYGVKGIAVMVFKPDSSHQLPSIPSREQMHMVADQIKKYKGNLCIEIESCFSQMRALHGKRFFANLNQGISKGCGAGRDGISVSVDGKLTPCRHLELQENFTSICEYWENSEILKKLRETDDCKREPCNACDYQQYCLPCMAVNHKMNDELYVGDTTCPIRPKEDKS